MVVKVALETNNKVLSANDSKKTKEGTEMEKRLSDLSLAAYLMSKNYKLKRVEKNGGKRVIFLFESSTEMENEILSYLNQEGTVEPLSYMEHLRTLKGLAKSFLNEAGSLSE